MCLVVLANISPPGWLIYKWYQTSVRLHRYFGTYIWLLWNINWTPLRYCFLYYSFVRYTLRLEFLWFSSCYCFLCTSGSDNGKLTSSSSSLSYANSSFAQRESFMVIDFSRSMFSEGRRMSVYDTTLSIPDIFWMLGPNSLSVSLHCMTLWDALIFAL